MNVLAFLLSSSMIFAADSSPTAGAAMTQAAEAFLAELTPEQRKKAQLPFDSPLRKDWHWIPKPIRKGVQIREMNARQREAAHALLRTGLSDAGYQKALRIFDLESVLHILENDTRNVRDPLKYFFTIFGTPTNQGTWGWSAEGHHLSANFVIQDGQLVAGEPTFFGANPRWMPKEMNIGPKKGERTLDAEERLGFELFDSLTDEQKSKAWIARKTSTKETGNLVTGPPAQLSMGSPVGLPVERMTQPQRALVQKILETYCSNVTPEAGAARLAAVKSAGLEKVAFAWYGADSLDENHYFRLQGPTFVLEMDNTQADPVGTNANHIHSLWRGPGDSFGMKP